MNNTYKMQKWTTQAVFLLAMATYQSIFAKTIQVENDSNSTVSVTLPHFASIATIDRYPTVSTFQLKPGEITELYMKPYQYLGSIYFVNYDWVLDAEGDQPEEDRRERLVLEEYSFTGKDPNKHFSIKVVDEREAKYYVPVEDLHIGELIQAMAESPQENPDDGILITKDKIEVRAGNDIELYNAVK